MNSVQPSNTFIYRQLKTPLLPKKKINSRPKHQGKLCAQFDIFMHSCTCTNVSSSADGNKRVTGLFFIFCNSLAINQVERKKHRQTPANGTVYYICIGIWIITHTPGWVKNKRISVLIINPATMVGNMFKEIGHSGKYFLGLLFDVLKFKYSEKAAKFWKKMSHFVLTFYVKTRNF